MYSHPSVTIEFSTMLDMQIFMRTHWSTCSLHKVKFDIIVKADTKYLNANFVFLPLPLSIQSKVPVWHLPIYYHSWAYFCFTGLVKFYVAKLIVRPAGMLILSVRSGISQRCMRFMWARWIAKHFEEKSGSQLIHLQSQTLNVTFLKKCRNTLSS